MCKLSFDSHVRMCLRIDPVTAADLRAYVVVSNAKHQHIIGSIALWLGSRRTTSSLSAELPCGRMRDVLNALKDAAGSQGEIYAKHKSDVICEARRIAKRRCLRLRLASLGFQPH